MFYPVFMFVSIPPFIACQPGSYKDSVGNEVSCSVCPTSSYATLPGSAICTCNDGYYRTSSEAADDPCTGQESSKIIVMHVGNFT